MLVPLRALQRGRGKYCSRRCKDQRLGPPVTKSCEACERTFTVIAARATTARYCSRRCLGRTNVQTINQIRRPAQVRPTAFRRGEGVGKNNHRWIQPIRLMCEMCGARFERKPWMIRQKQHANRFCSRGCFAAYMKEFRSGSNSPDWVGGQRTYRGRDWKRIRLQVVADQQGQCAHCRTLVGPGLPINHIRPFREFETAEAANERANLIGLCQSCHVRAEPRPSPRSLGRVISSRAPDPAAVSPL